MNEVQPQQNNGKMRNTLKSLNQRRKSIGLKNKNNNNNNSEISGLPKPPKRRNSQIGVTGLGIGTPKNSKPHHRPTATFFKKAVTNNNNKNNQLNMKNNQLNINNVKELQFVSQQLTTDVANKTQSIQNLEFANSAL